MRHIHDKQTDMVLFLVAFRFKISIFNLMYIIMFNELLPLGKTVYYELHSKESSELGAVM